MTFLTLISIWSDSLTATLCELLLHISSHITSELMPPVSCTEHQQYGVSRSPLRNYTSHTITATRAHHSVKRRGVTPKMSLNYHDRWGAASRPSRGHRGELTRANVVNSVWRVRRSRGHVAAMQETREEACHAASRDMVLSTLTSACYDGLVSPGVTCIISEIKAQVFRAQLCQCLFCHWPLSRPSPHYQCLAHPQHIISSRHFTATSTSRQTA